MFPGLESMKVFSKAASEHHDTCIKDSAVPGPGASLYEENSASDLQMDMSVPLLEASSWNMKHFTIKLVIFTLIGEGAFFIQAWRMCGLLGNLVVGKQCECLLRVVDDQLFGSRVTIMSRVTPPVMRWRAVRSARAETRKKSLVKISNCSLFRVNQQNILFNVGQFT